MSLGRAFGTPLRMHLSFLVLGVIVAVAVQPLLRDTLPGRSAATIDTLAAVLAVGLLASVVLHEIAHAVAARQLGMQVGGIHLWGLGGATALEGEPPTARAQYLVSMSGPVVNLLLGGAAALVAVHTGHATVPRELALRLAVANALLAGYNLLPGLPLDGGQVLRAGVWALTGDKVTGLRAAGYGGLVTAAATAVLAFQQSRSGGFGLFTLLVALFMGTQAQAALRGAAVARRAPALLAGNLARPAYLASVDLPLAEALRRAAADGRSTVLLGDAPRPRHVLSEALLARVPAGQRPWVPLSSVVRPTLFVGAQVGGEELLAVLRRDASPEHVVIDGERIVGVLRTADVAAALQSAP